MALIRLDRQLLASLEPLTVERITIPEGYHGTARTVAEMAKLIRKDSAHPYMVNLARRIVQEAGISERDYRGECLALFGWIKKNIHFLRDPYGVEYIGSAFKTLEYGAGDCDEFAILSAVLLNALGFPIRLITVKRDGPDFVHVYVETLIPGEPNWIAFDTAVPGSYLGWRATGSAQKIWGMEGFGGFDGLGLGDIWGDVIKSVAEVGIGLYTAKEKEKAAKKAEKARIAAEAAIAAAEAENVRRMEEAAEEMRLAKLAEAATAREKAISFVPETLTAIGGAMGSAKPLLFLGGGALVTALVYKIVTRTHKRRR